MSQMLNGQWSLCLQNIKRFICIFLMAMQAGLTPAARRLYSDLNRRSCQMKFICLPRRVGTRCHFVKPGQRELRILSGTRSSAQDTGTFLWEQGCLKRKGARIGRRNDHDTKLAAGCFRGAGS